jgi:hypothetical protein
MTARLGVREGATSAIVFGIVLFALVSFDGRGSITPWGDRAGDLGSALWSAARTQSLENAPLLVFVTVGAVLTVFMLRS